MIIVAGHLLVAPADREAYLAGCAADVRAALAAPGCLDFSLSPDPLDPARIRVYELWASRAELAAFRGSGPGDDQQAAILDASVAEYDVSVTPPPAER